MTVPEFLFPGALPEERVSPVDRISGDRGCDEGESEYGGDEYCGCRTSSHEDSESVLRRCEFCG